LRVHALLLLAELGLSLPYGLLTLDRLLNAGLNVACDAYNRVLDP
jgi:hypothetical protein